MGLCPICRKNQTMEAYKPFCSRRCADVDLQRWMVGTYVLPDIDDPVPERDAENDD